MKTREAIRNRVISYANLIWNTKRIDNLHPLIHLMVEEICNELYLMDNKLNDIDSTILEKLVHNISPTQFNYVRPASTIIHTRPDKKRLTLSSKNEFFIKEIPTHIRRQYISSVTFTPVTDVSLFNLGISHMFCNQNLWELDKYGNKKLIAVGNTKNNNNKLWIQLDNPSGIQQIEDLYFYLDFPHLNDNHDYYEVLSTLDWSAEEKVLETEEGFPVASGQRLSHVEIAALNYHEIHYQTIREVLHIGNKSFQNIPQEVKSAFGGEVDNLLNKGYWISISFPSHFLESDIEKVQILLNAFPALNRRYVELRQSSEAFTGAIALPSDIGEEFLELEQVIDSHKHRYSYGDTSLKNQQGIYSIEPIRKKDVSDVRIHDYLELFVDVLERERTAFPKIDRDKITDVQNSISSLLEDEALRVGLNVLNDYAEVARLSVNLADDATYLDIQYWTTLAEVVNGLPAQTALMATKITSLNKSEATLVTSVRGGRVLYDVESMKAINRFYLTSKGRILTKHDILSFCKVELVKYAEQIDVVRCAKVSSKPGAGIINAMEVQITPKREYVDFLNQKEVLRELKIRLSKRSPSNYNYVVTIIE